MRVLSFLPTYRTLADIGTQLGIGRPTVKTHVENIYKKLGAKNRAEAVTLAGKAGFLTPNSDPAQQRKAPGSGGR
jgi:DNA-binding NarL/FixJ family response regulator